MKFISAKNNVYDEPLELFKSRERTLYLLKSDQCNKVINIVSRFSGLPDYIFKEEIRKIAKCSSTEGMFAPVTDIICNSRYGYIMDVLNGFSPLNSFLERDRKSTSWKQWYLSTGGIETRLESLASIADSLLHIQNQGMVYSEISPSSIFISEKGGIHKCIFICPDALLSTSIPSLCDRETSSTFIAPEILKGQFGHNTLSASYSLSRLVYTVLLSGRDSQQSQSENEDNDIRKIGIDMQEESDSWTFLKRLIFRDIWNSTEKDYMDQFCEPLDRPGINEWSTVLHDACDKLIHCSSCGEAFFFYSEHCPWCGHSRPDFMVGIVNLCKMDNNQSFLDFIISGQDNRKPLRVDMFCLSNSIPVIVTDRLFLGHYESPDTIRRMKLQLDIGQEKLLLNILDDGQYYAHVEGKQMNISQKKGGYLKLSKNLSRIAIRMERNSNIQRVMRFLFVSGGSNGSK